MYVKDRDFNAHAVCLLYHCFAYFRRYIHTHARAHTHTYVFYLPHLTFCYRLERIICAFSIFLFLPDQGTNIDIYMHLGQERCCLSLRYYIHVCHYFSFFFSPFSVFCFLCLLCHFFVRY